MWGIDAPCSSRKVTDGALWDNAQMTRALRQEAGQHDWVAQKCPGHGYIDLVGLRQWNNTRLLVRLALGACSQGHPIRWLRWIFGTPSQNYPLTWAGQRLAKVTLPAQELPTSWRGLLARSQRCSIMDSQGLMNGERGRCAL